MAKRIWVAAGIALALSGSSGCRLFCDRYCERERDHCEHYNQNRGCCAPAPAPQCPPGCAPAYYGGPQPNCP